MPGLSLALRYRIPPASPRLPVCRAGVNVVVAIGYEVTGVLKSLPGGAGSEGGPAVVMGWGFHERSMPVSVPGTMCLR